MRRDNIKLSAIIGAVSRQAGAVVGESVVISKKIAAFGIRSVATARDLVARPIRRSAPVTDEEVGPTSEAYAREPRTKNTTASKEAMKALVAALESDLAAARRELKREKARGGEKEKAITEQIAKIKAKGDEAIAKVKADAEETIAKLKAEVEEKSKAHTKNIANIVHEAAEKHAKSQLSSDVSAVRTKREIEKQGSQPMIAKAPNPPVVTEERLHTAVFPGAAEKIIFTRALSDIASQDAATRADAARVMAGVRHDLSVKVLVAQMAREPSPRVRQECIKALTTLKMKEGLPAVERALTDRAASVRLAAVWGLYRLAGAKSAHALARMFSDKDEEVRRRSATCIGWLGQTELAVKLLPLLSDSSVSVRQAAVEAMGNLRSQQVVSALIERLNDPEKVVRKAVLGALKTITGKKMSGPFPKDKKSLQRLTVRWREWWKEEYPE